MGVLERTTPAVLVAVASRPKDTKVKATRGTKAPRPPRQTRPRTPEEIRWRMSAVQTGASDVAAATAKHPAEVAQETALPATFKRLIAKGVGSSFRAVAEVDTAPLAMPKEGQVLIKVLYTGINGGCETFRARGDPYTPFARNAQASEFALGAEGAGVVVAVGPGVQAPAVGTHVTTAGANTFAEYVVAPAQSCWPVDEATPEAVAITLSGVTAAVALQVTGGPLKEGETVIVTAAAGGTGHFAVQLALLAGCHVIATCGGPEKALALRRLGVHRVIDYKSEDVASVLDSEYPGKIDVAYEGVGGSLRRDILRNMRRGGRMLAVGYISGYPHNDGFSEPAEEDGAEGLPPDHQLMWRGMTVTANDVTVFGNTWSGATPEQVKECRRHLFELYREGRLVAWIDRSRSFRGVASIPDAIDYMLSGTSVGKVVAQVAEH